MKKIILFVLFLAAMVGCSKKDDSSSSSSNDPCANTICKNGGYCANGQCVCPPGYEGADCSLQKTPTSISITKIEITRFPATDGGAGWDLTSGPDIFPVISLNGTEFWSSPNYYENADPSSIYPFTPNPYAVISNPNSQYTIRLYDYDQMDANDWMGGINFIPYNNTNGFPSILNLDAGGSVAFKLYVTYTW